MDISNTEKWALTSVVLNMAAMYVHSTSSYILWGVLWCALIVVSLGCNMRILGIICGRKCSWFIYCESKQGCTHNQPLSANWALTSLFASSVDVEHTTLLNEPEFSFEFTHLVCLNIWAMPSSYHVNIWVTITHVKRFFTINMYDLSRVAKPYWPLSPSFLTWAYSESNNALCEIGSGHETNIRWGRM